jgi:hypothetical protein
MNLTKFRKELMKIMPGYRWTIHRSSYPERFISATGIMTAGFNRMSTVEIIRRKKDDEIEYEAKSAGFGVKSPWLSEYTDRTLPRALRGLQDHYSAVADNYFRHAADLQSGRKQV